MAKNFDPNASEPVFYSLLPDDDTVTGGRGSDTFIGNSIKNFLSGLRGNDVLRGEEGDDTLDGGEGADTLNGGEGNDLFIVDNTSDIVSGGSGVDKVLSSVSYVLASDVENLELTGNNNISGSGNALANFITGNAGGNLLEGLAGNDTLLGLDGNDLLIGGTGDDSLVGGKGDDTFEVDSAIDKIIELDGEGRDTVKTSVAYSIASLSNVENLELTGSSNINGAGNSLDNILSGNVGANSLTGDAGSDTLLGLAGNDTLAGGAGNDLMNGGAGNDSIDGGEGSSDIADFSSTTNNMVVDLSTSSAIGDGIDILRGIEVVVTGSGADKLLGDANANILQSGVGNDTLLGGAGNDTLDGGVGADSINGGAGRDAVDYSASAVAVRINLGSISQLTGEAEGDRLSSIEDVIGSAGRDTIIGDAFANLVEGRAGGDSLLGGAGADTLSYALSASGVRVNLAQSTLQAFGDAQGDTISGFEHLLGSAFDDTLSGDSSANLIAGGDGADYIVGDLGIDSLLGGVGKDTLVTDSLDNLVDGGDGQDAVISTQSVNLSGAGYVSIEDVYLTGSALTATGNNLANLLVGNPLKNTISGNDGGDTLDGGADADSLLGGAGNDFYIIDNAGDIIVENGPSSDQDTVNTSLANYTLASNLENLNYIGDANAKLTGNSLNNKISGGKWNDSLIGGVGNDTYLVNNVGDVVVETAGQGTDHVISNLSGYELVDNVEHLSYTGSGNANLLGNALNNSLLGNSMDNTLEGKGGVDTLSGGTGNDVYVVDSATDTIVDASGTDLVLSSVNFDLSNTLVGGGAVIEKLVLTGTAVSGTGNSLANTLTGNSLSNSLDGGAGIDSMLGGMGNDTYVIDNALDNIIEKSGEGTDLVNSKIANYTLADNFENLSYIGNENASLIGNSSNNSIFGNSNNNTLEGKGGVDTLSGGSGNDVFVVDSATDTIADSSGSDTVLSSVNFNLSSSLVGGGEVIENLRYIGTANASLTGNILNNSLIGNSMNNTLDGKSGQDTLSGGSGSDVYVVDSTTDTIVDATGSDTILSSVSFDLSNSLVGGGAAIENLVLTGSAVSGAGNSLDNKLTGNALNNTLTGGAGNDDLDGQVGNDTMVGGFGNDTYLVDSASDVVSEIAGEGTDLVISSVSGYTLSNNVENLTYTGTANASLIGNASNNSLLGNAKDNTLEGKGGIDTLSGGSGNDFYVVDTTTDTIVDAFGADTILSSVNFNLSSSLVGGGAAIENLVLTGTALAATGNSLFNTLIGNSLGNSLDGGAGDDSMVGGAGNDTYFVDSVTDFVNENSAEGSDLVISSVSGYTLAENVENLSYTGTSNAILIGNASNNSLTGNSKDNTLEGKGGVDTLSGGSGNDVYLVDSTTDFIVDTSGTDTVLSSVNFDLSNSLVGSGTAIENLVLTGTAIAATGSSLANTLSGNSLDNILDGGAGNDSLLGEDGNDILTGGAGADTLKGGLGNDTYYVSDLLDTIIDDGGANVICYSSGLNASAISKSGAGTYTLIEIAPSIIGGSGNETLTGNSLNDRIYGQGGNDSLRGLDGNDLLDGGTDNDTLSGGLGLDTLLGGAGTDSLDGGDGNDSLLGHAGQDTLVGVAGADFLDGGDSPDSLVGGAGADTLVYRTTSDTIQGGNDSDLVIAYSDVTLSGASFTDNIENLLLADTGTVGVGNSISNSITGNTSNNSLSGAGGNDTIDGALGNDTLLGDAGADSLFGGDGNDSLSGGTENDTLAGGFGLDTLLGGNGNDSLEGGGDVDSLVGGDGNDTYVIDAASVDKVFESALASESTADLIVVNGSFSMAQVAPPPIGSPKPNIYAGIEALSYSGSADVSLTGNETANTITAGIGNDYLSGGKGADTLIGGLGNDTYVYSDQDFIDETSAGGTDQVNTSEDIDLTNSSAEVENIVILGALACGATGNSIANSILGNAGSNVLRGLDGDDTLIGLDGNDELSGGSGENSLIGGTGNDTYIIEAITAEDGSIYSSDILVELPDGGTDEVQAAADVDLRQLPDFENVRLLKRLGESVTENYNVIGNALANLIQGNVNDNSIDGGAGADTLIGYAGNDTYYVDDSRDFVFEGVGFGQDYIFSTSNKYTIPENVEILKLLSGDGSAGYGNPSSNTLIGNASANSLFGFDSADSLWGGDGADTLDGGIDDPGQIIQSPTPMLGGTVLLGTVYPLNVIQSSDTMEGGLGGDYYFVQSNTDTVVESSSNGTEVDWIELDPVLSALEYGWYSGDGSTTNYFDTSNAGKLTINPSQLSPQINGIDDALTYINGGTYNYTLSTVAGANGSYSYNYTTTLSGGTLSSASSILDTSIILKFALSQKENEETPFKNASISIANDYFYVLSDNIENLIIKDRSIKVNNLERFFGVDFAYGNSLANYISVTSDSKSTDAANLGKDNYIDGQGGSDTMVGGQGNDTYIVNNNDRVLEDIGQGTDYVIASVVEGETYTLSNNVEILELATTTESIVDGRPVTSTLTGDALDFHGRGNSFNNTLLGNAGDNSLFGMDGNDILIGGKGIDSMYGGKGSDTYYVDNELDLVDESVGGGINFIFIENDFTDTFINTVVGGDARFQLVKQGETYGTDGADILTGNPLRDTIYGYGGDDVISGLAGNDLLFGDAGNDYIAGGTGVNTLIGGNGDDTLVVDTSMNWSIDGGAGTKDILIFEGISLALNNNATLTGIESVNLQRILGNSAITLGDHSINLTTITGGLGSDSITEKSEFGTRAITLDGGDGDDRFAFALLAQMKAASIFGGSGNDILAFSNGNTSLTNADLSTIRKSSIEILELNETGNGVTLGGNAFYAGITTIIGGTNNDIIDANSYSTGITIDVSRNTVANIGGNDATVIGGDASDLIIFSNHNVLGNSSVNGGTGIDTLAFNEDGISITDERFNPARLNSIEVIKSKNGTNYFNIGANAAASDLSTLIGGNASDTFEASALFTSSIAINSGDGDDMITLANAEMVNRSTLIGGAEKTADTLALSDHDTLEDEYLLNVTGVEILRAAASGASSFTVGLNAQAGGIRTVIGGDDNDTLNAAAYTTGMTLNGGIGDDSLVVSTGAMLGQSFVDGGSGTDKLSFAIDALSVTDADFVGTSSIEVLKTVNGNNRVLLGANAEVAGIATVVGGSGKDTLNASAYTTGITLNGDTGIDSLLGGTGNDYFIVDSTSDVIVDAGGIDTQATSDTNTTLVSFIENLVFTGTGAATLTGNSSANSLLGNTGSQTLVGTTGDDTLDGGAGADSLYGGAGNNFYVIDDAGDTIANETGGNDTILTKLENYTLGGGGIEALALSDGIIRGTGSSSDNTVTGNSIGNSLDGGTGIDTLIGGAGNDSYYVDNTGDIVDERIGSDWYADAGGTDIVYSSVTFDLWLNGAASGSPTVDAGGGQTISLGSARFVEGLVLTGSADIDGYGRGAEAGVSGNTSLTGNSGKNFLGAGYANDTLDGGAGDDTLAASRGVDSLVGGDGADSLDGGAGIDTMLGGDGNDTYVVDNVSDVTTETNSNTLTGGVDLVQSSVSHTLSDNIEKLTLTGTRVHGTGNSLDNTIVGNTFYSSLIGAGGNDSLFGDWGDQTLDGGIGNDTLAGGVGIDVYLVDSLLDVVTEVAGGWFNDLDHVIAKVNNYTLAENVEKLTLFEGAGILNGTGNSLDNTLTGNSLDNSLDGGLSAPWFWAGDSMAGGAGNDTFFVDNIYDEVWEFAGEGTDDLVESSVSFTLGANIEKLTLTGSTAVSATGNASANTLTGNSIANSIDGGAGVDSLVGGAGNDTYFVDDSLDAIYEVSSQGTDWVVISANNYTLGSEVENLTYTGTGNATFVGNASANIIDARVTGTNNLSGLAGDDILIVDASRIGTVNGGADNDSLRFVGTAGMTLGDSDFGGFTNIESFLFSDVSGDINIAIGSAALALNIATLSGGTANSTLTALSTYGANGVHFTAGGGSDSLTGYDGNDTLVAGTGSAKLSGGAGTDRFEFSSGTQLLANTVVGGAGDDTLALTAAATLSDAQFVNASGVESIHASSLSSAVVLGINAQASGIASLFGGVASDSLSAAGMSSGNIYIQGTIGASTLGDTLVAGTGSNRATLVGNNGADTNKSANYFLISAASLLGNNSIVGGASSIDYLQFTDGRQTLSDASFAQVSGLDGLILTGGANTITLGVTAQAKFGTTITLTGGTGGSDTIDLSGTTKAVYVNALTGYYGDTITAGANNNTLIGGAGATANDLFIFTSGSNLSGASIVGGGGTDTLRLSANGWSILDGEVFVDADNDGVWDAGETFVDEDADTIWDTGSQYNALNSLSDIEVLDINGGGNKIKLGASIAKGIQTIVGGTGPNTIDAANYNSAPNALTWNMNASNGSDSLLGGANGNLFQIKNGANLQNSNITGVQADAFTDANLNGVWNTGEILTNDRNANGIWDAGLDTIQLLAGAQTLGDTAFNNISSIEKLQLGSATTNVGNSITLGTIAASKGIATVIGGTRRDTIDATAFNSAITIDASASSGSRLIGSTANGNLNTLIGGSAGGNEFVLGAISTNSLVGGSGSNGLDTLTLTQGGAVLDSAFTPISKIGTLKLEGTANTVTLGANALIAGIRTLVGGEGNDLGTGNSINTSGYGSAGVLFQITDQDYLANITTLVGGTGVDTLKFSRDDVSVTVENVAKLTNIDVLQVANGTNRFLMHDDFYTAGIDSIVGGTVTNIIDMSHPDYDPLNVTSFDDSITFDMSAGSYSLLVNDSELRYAKVIGGSRGGSVSITDDIGMVTDIMFSNLYDAKISSVSYSGASIALEENAMATGMSILNITETEAYVWDFNAPLVINGMGTNSAERVFTSFAALANLTFNGGGGSDTLAIEFSDARVITSLKGDFDVLALDGGNNFVRLGNDAGLSVIVGGTGADTLNFSANTTGINFVMNASLMGATVDDALITGGSGSDMLTIEFGLTTANTLDDIQFTQTSLKTAIGDTLNGFTTDTSEIGGVIVGQNYYIFDEIFDATGISRIFAHNGDTLDAGGASGPLNFILGEDDFPDVEIIGTAGDDTLTLNIATVPSTVTIDDVDFALQDDLEFLVLNSVDPLELRHAEFIVELGTTAQAAGIRSVVGGNGGDSLDASSMTQAVTLSGGLNVRLDKDSPTSLTILQDTLIGGSSADSLYGDNFYDSLVGNNGADTLKGTSSTALGSNEIDTLTGGGGNDFFVLGDATNAYYNTGARASDYALITDFTAGDKIQLKDLSALYSPTAPLTNDYGYLIDGTDIHGVGALGAGVNSYLYADTDKSGTITTGDNLIAAINSTVVLTNVNATNFNIV